ncbi:MAG: hypothetical protein PF637_04210 [Spirochaetes bacterium]|nr:hypothetical protein [Spirochaetota bacterium]
MKELKKSLIVLLMFGTILIPSGLFALINMEVFTGSSFAGKIAGQDSESSVSGMNYGFRFNALYRIPFFDFGLGGYMQGSPLTYELDNETYKLNKLSLGLDSFARFKPELLPVFPYIRAGLAVYDKSETTMLNSDDITISEFNFDASYYGLGVSYPLVPMPIIDVHLFMEYLYDVSRVTNENDLKCHKLNFGMFMSI